MQTFDCSTLIKSKQGEEYTHEYDNYLNFFHFLACSDTQITCTNVPSCWGPFILYLGHKVDSDAIYEEGEHEKAWDCCNFHWLRFYQDAKDKRRAVEIVSACRPELVHALYCADTEWPCLLREKHKHEKSFYVTCNASFFRPEVLEYKKKLMAYKPKVQKAVLVPCAAAKPYPAPLHKEVLKRINLKEWHVITATGVLGLVPQELWHIMPHYDSGLPNIINCSQTVEWYFTKHKYTHLLIYSDFYAYAIRLGLDECSWDGKKRFVCGSHYRDHYENLLEEKNLLAFEEAYALLEQNEGD